MKDSSVIPCVGWNVVKILILYFCIKKFNSVMLGALFYLKLMSFHIKALKDNIIWTSILLAFLNSMIECHQSILRQLILINVFNEKKKIPFDLPLKTFRSMKQKEWYCVIWCSLHKRKNVSVKTNVPYTKRKNVSVKTNDSYTLFNYSYSNNRSLQWWERNRIIKNPKE